MVGHIHAVLLLNDTLTYTSYSTGKMEITNESQVDCLHFKFQFVK